MPPCPPPQDVLCTPARRLLQDSQDVPVTVAPLRAERVLLFDDALVLLQVGMAPARGSGAAAGVRGLAQKGGGSENSGSWGGDGGREAVIAAGGASRPRHAWSGVRYWQGRSRCIPASGLASWHRP